MDVQRISDELEIAALLSRYARAVDTKDWALYRSVFTDDAYVDYSSAGVIAGTPRRGRRLAQPGIHRDRDEHALHHQRRIELEQVDGDTATVRAMFYNPFQLSGMSDISHCGGYYHHELVRTAPMDGAAAACGKRTCGSRTRLPAEYHTERHRHWASSPQVRKPHSRNLPR